MQVYQRERVLPHQSHVLLLHHKQLNQSHKQLVKQKIPLRPEVGHHLPQDQMQPHSTCLPLKWVFIYFTKHCAHKSFRRVLSVVISSFSVHRNSAFHITVINSNSGLSAPFTGLPPQKLTPWGESAQSYLQYDLVKRQSSKREIIVRVNPVGEQHGRLHANLMFKEEIAVRENIFTNTTSALNQIYCMWCRCLILILYLETLSWYLILSFVLSCIVSTWSWEDLQSWDHSNKKANALIFEAFNSQDNNVPTRRHHSYAVRWQEFISRELIVIPHSQHPLRPCKFHQTNHWNWASLISHKGSDSAWC